MIVGTMAFLCLVPLAITSTRGWIRRMGKNWTKLHRLIYVAAVLGTIHYLWAVKKDKADPLFYLTIFIVLLGYRLIEWRRKKAATRAPLATPRRVES